MRGGEGRLKLIYLVSWYLNYSYLGLFSLMLIPVYTYLSGFLSPAIGGTRIVISGKAESAVYRALWLIAYKRFSEGGIYEYLVFSVSIAFFAVVLYAHEYESGSLLVSRMLAPASHRLLAKLCSLLALSVIPVFISKMLVIYLSSPSLIASGLQAYLLVAAHMLLRYLLAALIFSSLPVILSVVIPRTSYSFMLATVFLLVLELPWMMFAPKPIGLFAAFNRIIGFGTWETVLITKKLVALLTGFIAAIIYNEVREVRG